MTQPQPPQLFLDFDGVLHPATCEPAQRFSRSAALVETLEGLTCEIVISSSWRHHHPLSELLRSLPPALAQRVIGHTGPAWVGRWARWHEIDIWRRRFARDAPWRALDDADFEFPPHCAELIPCDPNTGFGPAQASLLRAWALGTANAR